MTRNPASRAARLVRRARGRAFRHGAARALLRGLSAGAVVASGLAVVARMAGWPPGAWLLVALLPATAVAAAGLVRARPSLLRAALLLDRAAGTRERFVSSLEAEDEEVRDLVARQAVEGRDAGELALSFPPSTEGLVAALSAALLVAVIFLARAPAEDRTSVVGSRGAGVASGAPTERSRNAT